MIKIKTPLKYKLFLVALSPIIALSYLLSLVLGFIWGWLYSGFFVGNKIACKLTGYETTEEIIDRKIKETK